MSFAEGYIDVAARIAEFIEKYPSGSLQMDEPEVRELNGDTYLVARAYAYRSPEDEKPGVGHAWEIVPGRTPYTRGSELMNLETSVWGRALAAIGIATRNGIATAEEVRGAEARREPDTAPKPHRDTRNAPTDRMWGSGSATATPKQLGMLRKLMRELGTNEAELDAFTTETLGFSMPTEGLEKLGKNAASSLIDALMARKDSAPKITRVSHSDQSIKDTPVGAADVDPWQTEEIPLPPEPDEVPF
jgi:hypothetical protein